MFSGILTSFAFIFMATVTLSRLFLWRDTNHFNWHFILLIFLSNWKIFPKKNRPPFWEHFKEMPRICAAKKCNYLCSWPVPTSEIGIFRLTIYILWKECVKSTPMTQCTVHNAHYRQHITWVKGSLTYCTRQIFKYLAKVCFFSSSFIRFHILPTKRGKKHYIFWLCVGGNNFRSICEPNMLTNVWKNWPESRQICSVISTEEESKCQR